MFFRREIKHLKSGIVAERTFRMVTNTTSTNTTTITPTTSGNIATITTTTSFYAPASVVGELNLTTTTTTSLDTTYPTVLSPASRGLLGALLVVVVVVSVAGNSVLCGLVHRKAAMRSPVNLLVAQLALTDVLLALLVAPTALVGLLLPRACRGGWSKEVCAAGGCLHDVLTTLNACLLAAISLDRCLIIVHRKDKLSARRARFIIVFSWVFSLLASLGPLLGWGRLARYPGHPLCWQYGVRGASDRSYVMFNCLLGKGVPLAAMLYSYAHIVSAVRKRNRKVHHCPLGMGPGLGTGPKPQARVSVTGALRDFTCPRHFSVPARGPCSACCVTSRDENSDVTSSSASRVCYVSVSSSVFLLPSPSTATSASRHCLEGEKDTTLSANGSHPEREQPFKNEPSQNCCPSCSPLTLPCSDMFVTSSPGNSVSASSKQRHSPPLFTIDNASDRNSRSPSAQSSGRRLSRKQVMDTNLKTRSFKTLFLLALLLSFCVIPYVIADMTTSVTSNTNPGMLCVLLWLVYVKTALNPVLYVCRIRKFRAACGELVPGWLRGCVCCGCAAVLHKRRVDPGAVYQCPEPSVSVS